MRRRAGALAALLAFCLFLPCAQAETGTVTASALVLRAGAGLTYDMLGELPYGAVLSIEGYTDGWFLIDYDGLRGYVAAHYVQVNAPTDTYTTPVPTTTPIPIADDSTAQTGSGLPQLMFTGDNNPAYPMVLKPGDMGNSVIDLQQTLNELGYSAGSTDGQFGYDTQAAVMRLQRALGIDSDGIIGPQTRRLIGNDNIGGVELLNWWKGGNVACARLNEATVIDVRTGKRFTISRYGGDNHLDAEPLTAADSAIMKSIYGGEWSWDRRPIWLEVNGRVIAASMNGMPHDGQHIWDNDFDGQFCIHFAGSRTHVSDKEDEEHNACIQEAWNNRGLYAK